MTEPVDPSAEPVGGRLAALLGRGALVGAGTTVSVTLVQLAGVYGDDSVQGVEVKSLRGIIESGYRDEVLRAAALSLALSALVGLGLGLVAAAALASRSRLLRGAASERAPRSWQIGLLAAWLLACALAVDVSLRPQLHEHELYAHGGLRAALQVALTALSPVTLSALLLLLTSLVLGWPARARGAAQLLAARRAELSAAWLRFRPPGARLGRPALAIAAAVALGLLLLSLRGRARPVADPSRPNVLVLAVDSWRFDRLNARTAPFSTRLAQRGTTFTQAYVSLPRTFPSWVTLLSGRHPHHHGVRTMFPSWEVRTRDVDPLPRRFGHAGYATLVVGDFAADIFGRIDLGFSRVDTPTFNFRELIRVRVLSAQTALLPFLSGAWARQLAPSLNEMHEATDPQLVTERALSAIDRAGPGPFFGTVFYSSAHFPYAAPAPYYKRFVDPAYRGRYRYSKSNLLGLEGEPSDADVAQVRALYDGGVAAADAAMGQLIDGLERRGLLANTVIVLTADHGECLYEQGRGQGHGDHLFGDESTHVPLVIVDPRKAPRGKVDGLVRDVDLAPTLYALAGVESPTDLDGRSLAPALEGAALSPVFAYAETGLWFTRRIPSLSSDERLPYGDLTELLQINPQNADDLALRPELELPTVTAKHRMVRDARFKLVYLPTRSGPVLRLYDTQQDPDETHDVVATHPDDRSRLETELWRWMLEDRRMERRGGLLVPRRAAWHESAGDGAGVRIEGESP